MLSRLLQSRLVQAGLVLLVLGTGPLVAIIVAASLGLTRDPDPNPIGPGILAMLTFWPSVALIAIGAARVRDGTPSVPANRSEGRSGITDNWKLLIRGPLGRGLAGMAGVYLLLNGASGLAAYSDGAPVHARGAAAAIVLGVVGLIFAIRGELPSWFRR